MFRVSVEERIREAVLEQTGISLTREQVHMMKTVPDTAQKPNKFITCLQVDNQTILVPIKITDSGQDIEIEKIGLVIW